MKKYMCLSLYLVGVLYPSYEMSMVPDSFYESFTRMQQGNPPTYYATFKQPSLYRHLVTKQDSSMNMFAFVRLLTTVAIQKHFAGIELQSDFSVHMNFFTPNSYRLIQKQCTSFFTQNNSLDKQEVFGVVRAVYHPDLEKLPLCFKMRLLLQLQAEPNFNFRAFNNEQHSWHQFKVLPNGELEFSQFIPVKDNK